MRRLWRLAIRNWSASKGGSLASFLSVALGVSTVVLVCNVYATVRHTLEHDLLARWLGNADITIHPIGAHWGGLDSSIAVAVSQLTSVSDASAHLQRRMAASASPDDAQRREGFNCWVDAFGINPTSETKFNAFSNLDGRLFAADERGLAVIERQMSLAWQVDIGDRFSLRTQKGERFEQFTVVGTFESRRIGGFQHPQVYLPLPDLQLLTQEPATVSAIHVMVKDDSPDGIETACAAVKSVIDDLGHTYKCNVESSQVRQTILEGIEQVGRLSLLLASIVAMLTAFFIILSTMSMSLFERRRMLGVMRCVGLTREQLAVMVLLELLPLGVVASLAGLIAGIGLTKSVETQVRPWLLEILIVDWGLLLGAVCGIVTTLVVSAFLMVQVARVTPLEAVNVEVRPPRLLVLYLCGVVGIVLIGLHEVTVHLPDAHLWLSPVFAAFGAGSLYLGYILLTPMLVVWLGPFLARLTGWILRLPGTVAVDQFGRSPWRSTAVCWMLVVGLGLMAYIVVAGDTALRMYDFSRDLPRAYVWSRQFVPSDVVREIEQIPGVTQTYVMTDVDCKIVSSNRESSPDSRGFLQRFVGSLLRPVFVAGDPKQVMRMVQVQFDEGSKDEAIRKLSRGGYVLIPTQTSRNRDLHLGDRVTIGLNDRTADFEIAGVVQSPLLDLVVTALQANSYLQVAAASVVFGSNNDLRDKFDIDAFSLVMCDLELPSVPPPPEFKRSRPLAWGDQRIVAEFMLKWLHQVGTEGDTLERIGPSLRDWLNEAGSSELSSDANAELSRFQEALRLTAWWWERESPEERWVIFRERLVLLRMRALMKRSHAVMGSMRRLKESNERDLRGAIRVLAWLPRIVLAVAAIGIGNLMTVSVRMRAKQIAVLRSIGTLRSQIVRLVLAEALCLGLIGAVTGLVFGVHQTYSDNRIVGAIIGIQPRMTIPVFELFLSALFTIAICLLAGIIPARHAAKDNIREVLQIA